jgi:hypothetical protein
MAPTGVLALSFVSGIFEVEALGVDGAVEGDAVALDNEELDVEEDEIRSLNPRLGDMPISALAA